jgi:hypothetical protein
VNEPDRGAIGPESLAAKVLEYERVFKRVAASASSPEFGRVSWAPLAELVAVDRFERVGIWRESMSWDEYTEMLTKFTKANAFESSRQRIAEAGRRVFFDREERHFDGDRVHVVNAMSVYEFDDDGKICHLDVYIQGEPGREAR